MKFIVEDLKDVRHVEVFSKDYNSSLMVWSHRNDEYNIHCVHDVFDGSHLGFVNDERMAIFLTELTEAFPEIHVRFRFEDMTMKEIEENEDLCLALMMETINQIDDALGNLCFAPFSVMLDDQESDEDL